ncbi:MAG: hypothetical protein S4CHLAM20_04750 [Chlamydiia bacterium]|nr:hypothetical protein [Chlamydiia bacterium]
MSTQVSTYHTLPESFYENQAVLAIMFPSAKAWDAIDPNDKRIHPMLKTEGGRIFLTIITIITVLPFLILRLLKYPVSINGSKTLLSSDDVMTIFKNTVSSNSTSRLTLQNKKPQNRVNNTNTKPKPPARKPPKIYPGAPTGLINFKEGLSNVCFANSVIQIVANTGLYDILQNCLQSSQTELTETPTKESANTNENALVIRGLEEDRHQLISSFLDICTELRLDKPNNDNIIKLTNAFYKQFNVYIRHSDSNSRAGGQHDSMELFNILFAIAGDSIGQHHESYFVDAQDRRLTNFRSARQILNPLIIHDRFHSVSQLLQISLTDTEEDFYSPNLGDTERPFSEVSNRLIFEYHVNQMEDGESKTKLQKNFERKADGSYKLTNPNFEEISIYKQKKKLYNNLLNNLGTKESPAKISDLRNDYIEYIKEQDAYIKRVTRTSVEKTSNEIIISTNSTSSSVNELEQEIQVDGDRFVLDATLCHMGGVKVGHYVSFVRKNNQWWCCNDNTVFPVKEPHHNFKTLFYRRAKDGEPIQTVSEEGVDINKPPKRKPKKTPQTNNATKGKASSANNAKKIAATRAKARARAKAKLNAKNATASATKTT